VGARPTKRDGRGGVTVNGTDTLFSELAELVVLQASENM
jgi:hypothetical protein